MVKTGRQGSRERVMRTPAYPAARKRKAMKTKPDCTDAKSDGTAVRDQAIVMPWDARAKELEDLEGTYCVYAAWEEWIEGWNDRQSDSMRIDLDAIDKIALFSAFMAACSEAA